MSDQNMDPEQSAPAQLREYAERQAREAAEAREQLAALQARELFRDAGLDPKNKAHAAIIRGYDGEFTEDAVASFVGDLGLTNPQPQVEEAPAPAASNEPEVILSQAEVEAHLRMQNLGGGPVPIVDGEAQYAQKIQGILDQAKRERWSDNQKQLALAQAAYDHPTLGGPNSVFIDRVPYEPH